MQAMLDEVAPKLKIGVRLLVETVRADARAKATSGCNSARSPRPILVAIRQLSVLRSAARA
jgi:hypothetical protein